MRTQDLIASYPISIQQELLSFFTSHSPLIIFDVGSCDGLDAIKYSYLFQHSSIFAFEPIPENFKHLQKNITAYKRDNIRPYLLALSDEKGTSQIFISSGHASKKKETIQAQSSSLLAPDKHLQVYPWVTFNDQLTVNTDTILHFCESNNIPYVDFMHLDVQGAELLVLKGAGDFISKIQCLWLEVEHISLYKNQPLRKEVENFMHANGFILVKFRVGGFSGDQFYVRKDFLKEKKGSLALLFYNCKSAWMRSLPSILIHKGFMKLKFLKR